MRRGGGYFTADACPLSSTIQACVRSWFLGSGGYISQGVIGVRLYFSLGGGYFSTAWDSSGNVRSAWVSNFLQIMKDLKSYGVQRVNPNVILVDDWAGTLIYPNPPVQSSCNSSQDLMFFKWLPFGLVQGSGYPDCQDAKNGYGQANSNPYFWGWTPYFNAVSAIVSQVKAAGLGMADFELVGEINLTDFPVEARMIWDNKHGSGSCGNGSYSCTDVLSGVRYYLTQNGFNYHVADYSVPVTNPTAAGYDCGSVYGDSAMLLHESSVVGALAGPNGLFGPVAGVIVQNGLPCQGNTSMMGSLPVSYAAPTSTDLHAYMCVLGSQGYCNTGDDATTTARVFFGDVWTFLQYRGLTGNYVVFGETLPNQPGTIQPSGFTQALATEEVNGYIGSALYTNHASSVTFRPFENPAWNALYNGYVQYTQFPAQLVPPY